MRYDIVSDTHGYLSEELLSTLEGADAIVHAGDICSTSDYEVLKQIAPLHLCLGNNDWDPYAYGPDVKDFVRFFSSGLRWQICHYERKLRPAYCDIAICGHSHRPFVRRDPSGAIVMNPGSPTWPRGSFPSIGRIVVTDGQVVEARIIQLQTDARRW
jgi:putative phosphoesterase